MNNSLLISLVIPTYNRSNYLKRCLDSILSQEVDCYEIIVSDNASPDDTQEVMQNYLQYSQIYYFRNETNLGARENIYKATKYAQGEYIFWLSDDDYLLPNSLLKVVDVINAHPEVGYIYSPVVAIDDRNGKQFFRRDDFQENKLIDVNLEHLPTVMSSAWVFSRQILKRELIDWRLWHQNKDNAYFMLIIVGNIFLEHPAYYIVHDLVHHIWFNTIHWEEFGLDKLSIEIRTGRDYSQCMKIVLANHKNKFQKFNLILNWKKRQLLSMLNNEAITNSFKSVGTIKTISLILADFQYNVFTVLWITEWLITHFLVSFVARIKYIIKQTVKKFMFLVLGKTMYSSILDAVRQWRSNRQINQLLHNSQFKATQIVDARQNRKINLEIGAGNKKGKNDWITLDLNTECDLYWDLLLPLPFPDNSIDMIYSSHVLEHFYYRDLIKLLENCHQVLKENGKISICVPDASTYVKAYLNPKEFDFDNFFQYKPAFNFHSEIDYINYIAYMDGHHRHMFDSKNLIAILEKMGFKNARLRELDLSLDKPELDYESIYAEATK